MQHYKWHYRWGDPQKQQEKDNERRRQCLSIGLTLIEVLKSQSFNSSCNKSFQVPYWWNTSIDSLAATVKQWRPDLLLDYQPVSKLAMKPIPTVDPATPKSKANLKPKRTVTTQKKEDPQKTGPF